MSNKVKIDISTSTIIKVLLAVLAVWFLYLTRDIMVLFFFVLIIVAALSPLVDKMTKMYIPRVLAVILLALIFLAIMVGIGFIVIPPLLVEIKLLAINLPVIAAKFGPFYQAVRDSIGNYQEILLNVSSQLGRLTSGIYSTTMGVISGVLAFFTVIILSFYMLLEQKEIGKYTLSFFAEGKREQISLIIGKISVKMGQWLGGHALLMLVIGICDGVALTIMGVPYALVLAVWGGLMEFIPYLGPWLGAIPAIAIALTISPLTALFVTIAFILIQQLEGNFLAPKIIGKAVGLSPVIVILSLLTGAKLMGVLGVLISVPIAAIISVLIQEWPEINKLRHN